MTRDAGADEVSALTATPPRSEGLPRSTILALAAMALAVFVIANDFCALSVALPDIEKAFNADVSTVQWVINAYALIFGVLIVTGGRLADLFGRRKTFIVGAAIFAGFSVLGGASQDAGQLIVCRALMGIGGALMWPAVLGMTFSILPEEKAGIAGGLILGAAGFGNAAGPLLGGALTDALSWRWILFVNLPIAIAACVVTLRFVAESRGDDEERVIDYAGIATVSTGLIAFLIGLDQVTDWGWTDPRVLVLFGLCIVLLVAFVIRERHAGAKALIPPDVMRNRGFAAAALAVLLMSATFFAALIYLPQFFQKILGWSPFKAGVALLPMMGTFAVTSFLAGPLYQRLGPKIVPTAGAVCLCAGGFLVSFADTDSGYATLVPAMVVLGIGVGLFYSSVTTAAVTALDPSRSSLAGGIIYMAQIAGGSVGLGLTTTVFTTAATDSVQGSPLARVLSSAQQADVHGILRVREGLPAAVAGRVIDVVREAFAAGMHWAFRLVALLALVGLAVTVLRVGGTLVGFRRTAPETAAAS
jgi:EmrB/QacA subfamily drug resistance transporter